MNVKMAYKVSDVVVNSIPVIFVSDSVNGSVYSGMSNIMVETNNCINFTGKRYPQVFDTAVYLAKTLDK